MSEWNRRDFLKALGAGSAAFSTGGLSPPLTGAAPAARGERPHIILCMTDDQGWGDTTYNGMTQVRTAALDAMAAEGMRFNRFYAAHPSCSPTRASVMTGRHPNRMGCFWPGMKLRRQEVTIAQAVKRAGYTTGHFGKWHLNGVPRAGKPVKADDPLGPGPFGFDYWFSVSNWFDRDWTFSRNGQEVKTAGDGSEAIMAEAIRFIGRLAEQKKPSFSVIWFGSPHGPHKAMPADKAAAGGSDYYGEILAVDRSMGRLRAALRRFGIADNTLLWFCSDNGGWTVKGKNEQANGGLRGRKGDMWEGGIRVPGLVEWPARIRRPVTTEVQGNTSDIYPTLVDILKVDVPNQVKPLDGISLLPLFDGTMTARPAPMGFWQYDDTGGGPITSDSGPSAWSENRYKLHKIRANTWELYDIIADPKEQNDIAPRHPERVARMKIALENWQQSVLRSLHGKDYPPNSPKSG